MTELVAPLAILVLVWFAAGTIWNVRKGRALMRWMQGGLPLLGERTTVRWLGSTAVEMTVRDARPPFAHATVVIFLEARDVPWIWALSRRRGRRDTLIVRGALRATPKAELDVLDPASWSGRDALPGLAGPPWDVRAPSVAGDLAVYYTTAKALHRADTLIGLACGAGLAVRRLAVRRTAPHFELHVGLPAARTPAEEFFRAVRALAEHAAS
jgi:hypothetical protein